VIRIAGWALVRAAFFAIAALPGSLQAQGLPEAEPIAAAAAVTTQSPNIQVDPLLEPLVARLLERSPTLRRQWQAIGSHRVVRVSLFSSPLLRETSTAARARTEFTRHAFGAIRAVVVLPTAADITELLPHELEHVLEQIEGLDLPALSRQRASGVHEVGRGTYETDRARHAGLSALREVYGATDPALSSALRQVQRAFKALLPAEKAAETTAAPPPAPAAPRRRAAPGGPRRP
jgi:hypothetical protein